ncbi:MAG TPA: hypothetical protein VFI31_07000 [Pirellulales bacterium]|nr:hypothetical protein [Pirellulales bacterium]
MKLTHHELEFLAAWAREEWEPACYELPAHRLQLAHGVVGAHLLALIKAWTDSEGKKDQEILAVAVNAQPRWPWSTTDDFVGRLTEANERRARREATNSPPEPAAG